MPYLSVEGLYALPDNNVIDVVRSAFTGQLQCAPSVHDAFFSDVSPSLPPADPDWVDRLAIALVCSGIGRSSMLNFSAAVRMTEADAYWESQLALDSASAIQASRQLYDALFPYCCRTLDSSTTFSDYMNSMPAVWAAQLASHVTELSFINTEIAKLLSQDANWPAKLNLVFYKLSRLDASTVAGVVDAWTRAFPDKGVSVQWQSDNYVPCDIFQPDQFLPAVNKAIGTTQRVEAGGHYPIPYVIYGEAVVQFLRGPAAAQGYATGIPLHNVEPESESNCFLPGTPIHLSDGTTLPVERIGQGHRVLAQHGRVSTRTREEVAVAVAHPRPVYGINEQEPFFSAGHAFRTRDGWKAVDPALAMRENPHRPVGRLQPGDVVFRLRTVSPLTYDEIVVRHLPMRWASPGVSLYGLHLHGERSYHAHGFLVAMNYPVVTAARLQDAFSRLTPHERALLARQFEPLYPLLNSSLGRFLEPALRKALR